MQLATICAIMHPTGFGKSCKQSYTIVGLLTASKQISDQMSVFKYIKYSVGGGSLLKNVNSFQFHFNNLVIVKHVKHESSYNTYNKNLN